MVYCSLNKSSSRKKPYSARPEEIVRQKLLHFLVSTLLFPKDLIAVEKAIADHNSSGHLSPKRRRADIICYSVIQGVCRPLLLIECKKSTPSAADFLQLEGYNTFVNAPFVALVTLTCAHTGYYDKALNGYRYQEGLLDYASLKKLVEA
jgi:hypothetical protein